MADYNGHILPGPPAYDTDAYPYAMVYQSDYGCIFYISPVPFVYQQPDVTISQGSGCPTYSYDSRDGDYGWTRAENGSGCTGTAVIWCNHDILNVADGSVYLAASPIVYAGWKGLESWLAGFALGLAGKPFPVEGGQNGNG